MRFPTENAVVSCLFYPSLEFSVIYNKNWGKTMLKTGGLHAKGKTSTLKAGVHRNRSEIWSNIKRELLGLKWVGSTTRQLAPQKKAPSWQGLYASTNSLLQISIFQIHQIFNVSYFPQFDLSFEKTISLSKNTQKSPKNLHKAAQQWLMKWA